MRLADFILCNIEPILVEWEAFAHSVWPSGQEKEPRELRDHVELLLRAIAADMKSLQSSAQQSSKSKGERRSAGTESERLQTAAGVHAIDRARSGLNLMIVISEYRALRASVIRLWEESNPELGAEDFYDRTRFNESIDESVAEAARSYTEEVDLLRQQAEKERLEFEAQIQKAQNLESIGVLAGGIAHDFNNLLAGLFGYVEVARMYAEGGSVHKVTSTLDSALSVMGRAKDLSQQLLTFSKGGGPTLIVANISRPIKDAVTFSLSGSNVEGDIQLTEQLWPCKIDPNQIVQALNNIIINAKEAMPNGGRIFVTAENIPEGSQLPATLPIGNYVRISITDRGHGIPADTLERIFDPFFTTKESGQGLGLSIAYSIAKKHNGIIQVESEVNKGTTIHIYLPASLDSVVAAPVVEESHSRPPGRGRILVMDDEHVVQDVVGTMLEGLGYSVAFAANGEEAIRQYEEARQTSSPFNVAILDLTVRDGLGGKDTVKKLHEIDPLAKAIVSSGYSNDPVMTNPEGFGFNGSLTKPYQSKDLDDMLHFVLGDY